MLRETDMRGARWCPASFHASRYASIGRRCWTCSGSPLSSSLSVELWRFMPSFAAHCDVAFEAEPHQMRSRKPAECGSTRSSPGGLENIGCVLGVANPSPLSTSSSFAAWRRAMSASLSPQAGGQPKQPPPHHHPPAAPPPLPDSSRPPPYAAATHSV